MLTKHLAELRTDGAQRVEGSARILWDQRQTTTAGGSQFVLGCRHEVAPVEDRCTGRAGRSAVEAHHRSGGHRLAAATLAEQHKCPAPGQVEVDAAYGPDRLGPGAELGV